MISQHEGLWSTTWENTRKLLEAYLTYDHVILLFSVNFSRKFYGYARMNSIPQKSLSAIHFSLSENDSNGPFFKIHWLSTSVIPFEQVGDITNSLNENLPVKIVKDGQELSTEAGGKLCIEIEGEIPILRLEKTYANFLCEEINSETLSISTENSIYENQLKDNKKTVKEEVYTKKHKNIYVNFRVVKKKKLDS